MGDKIVPRAEKFDKMKSLVTSKKAMDQIAMALPKHITPEKMARVVLTSMIRSPKLLECTPASVMDAVLQASQLGLLPDGVLGHGYILPYKDRAVFIPGYKGLIDLARRSGEISWLQARAVFENDSFGYSYGMDNTLSHVPARASGKEPGKLIAVYAIAKFKSGEFQFEVMYKDQVEEIRQRARAANDGPWVTDYEQMALKTVIRRLCKFLPLNPEHQALVTRDEYAEAGALDNVLDLSADDYQVVEEEDVSPLDALAEAMEADKAKTPPPPAKEPEQAPPEPPPENGPKEDSNESLPFVEGQGRISRDEDANFIAAVENLKERMRKVATGEQISRLIANRCGVFGAEKPIEIRSRSEREKFYKELKDMCEQWESMPNMMREE